MATDHKKNLAAALGKSCRAGWLIGWASLVLLILSGCSNTAERDTGVAEPAPGSRLAEGFFVVPGADFSRYRQLILPELRMDAVRGPDGRTRNLNEQEQFFFREHYLSALVGHLIAGAGYTTSLDAGREVMMVRATIEQIAPLVEETSGAQERALQRYQSEVNSLTLSVELVDSLSGVPLARLVMTGDIGISREEGNWMANNTRIAALFDRMLATLHTQLHALRQQ